jgi:hypothetical protein
MNAPRGSDLLKHRYTERDLEELLEASAIDGVKVVDFFPKGIPAPDGGWGVWHVPNDRVADLLANLLKLKAVPNIRLFPKGAQFG